MSNVHVDELLPAAREVVREHGLAGMTIERVAEHAGLSRVTLHRWGVKRDALVLALVKATAEEMRVALWPALAGPGTARDRMELALLDAHREGKVAIPLVEVDFGKAGVPEVGAITSLDAPHRLADAILRDSTLNGVLFRKTEEGKTLDTANTRNATGLFELCPTALLLGLWDSAGPLGGLGTKFARTLVSEIVAVNVAFGARPTSRIDPLGIQLAAGPVFKASAGGITLKKENAVQEKGAPVKVGKEGKPSEANHGNVTPSLVNDKTKKPHHGGVTMDYALQSAVLSLPGLRRLRFPDADHKVSAERNVAAQTVLAALGLSLIHI